LKDIIDTIKILIALLGTSISYFLGGWDGIIYALLTFSVIDYLTGLMLAIVEKKISSEVGFRGISKKVLIFALVGIGNLLDVHLIKNGSAIRTAVLFFYIANEGISIIENASKLGLPVPNKLKIILKDIKENDEK
jgi:toxin secretion/phage lysis holin